MPYEEQEAYDENMLIVLFPYLHGSLRQLQYKSGLKVKKQM